MLGWVSKEKMPFYCHHKKSVELKWRKYSSEKKIDHVIHIAQKKTHLIDLVLNHGKFIEGTVNETSLRTHFASLLSFL